MQRVGKERKQAGKQTASTEHSEQQDEWTEAARHLRALRSFTDRNGLNDTAAALARTVGRGDAGNAVDIRKA